MAYTTLNLAAQITKWDADFFSEYVRENLFKPYMGTASGNALMPILANHTLTTGGKTVDMSLMTRLTGSGVQGTNRLTGREEKLGNYNHPITVNWNRNGVVVKKPTEHWSVLDIRRAAKAALKPWAIDALRDDLISAMLSYSAMSILRGKDADATDAPAQRPAEFYASFTEAQKDAWLAANADRFLFGAAVANGAGNDHSAALATIDNANDTLSTASASLAKSLARETVTSGDGAIRPFRVDGGDGREWFVMFCNSRSFRDLKRDPAMVQANRDARPRDVANNPIFSDGDLVYDGIIFREIPEIPVIKGVGAGGIDVAPNFLCGAQAVGVAWGQEPKSHIKEKDDYDFEWGVAIEECRATAKMAFRGKQHGMVTVFASAVASA